MKPTTIAFAGAGGYADYCLDLLGDYVNPDSYRIAAVIDPFAAKAPKYGWFCEQHIPVYDTLEEFYAETTADVLYIATPIHLHKPQCEIALAHHTHVMCEKPLTPRLQDALELKGLAEKAGCLLGIGFQWSYAPAMLNAKRDILNGLYGKPLSLKAYVSWRRFDNYYSNSWKGHIRCGNEWILDSVVTNGTAHYLHNIFFMLGGESGGSRMPQTAEAAVYRAKEIESFDTCVVKGSFSDGAEFLYLATHSGDADIEPVLEYTFEKGQLSLDLAGAGSPLLGTLSDGRVIDYGSPSGRESEAFKLRAVIRAAQGLEDLTCGVEAVLPHLKVCNAIIDQLPILDFPKELVFRSEAPAGSFVKGLADRLLECYRQNKTPSELGLPWAAKEQPLELDNYSRFIGKRF